jgi:RNA binding exosome subunit
MAKMLGKLSQLAIDIYENRLGNYTKDDATNALREEFKKICGTDEIDRKVLRRHKTEIFEIIEETLDVLVGRKIQSAFEGNAEYKSGAWGDKPEFILKNPKLYKVAIVSDGNQSLRRQRLDNGKVTITTSTRGVKIYEEFLRFLAGRIDWAEMVNKVADSYVNQIYTEVYTALYDSYNSLTATYAKNGAFNETTMRTLIEHIEAANNVTAAIYGTKNALSNVTSAQVSDAMKDVYSSQGYYGSFYGTPMRKIVQSHTNGTETFAVNESFLIILPEGDERIVKVYDEGDSIIEETADGVNQDFSKEYTFLRKSGIAVVTSAKHGVYRLV